MGTFSEDNFMLIERSFKSGAFIESVIAVMLNYVDTIYLHHVDFDTEFDRDA